MSKSIGRVFEVGSMSPYGYETDYKRGIGNRIKRYR